MSNQVKPIPDGQESVTPYLGVSDAVSAIEFYKKGFRAVELYRLSDPSGKIAHAEIKIGNAAVMLADEHPDHGHFSPQSLNGSPVALHIYVGDVDAFVSRAVEAGAKILQPVEDQFYGDRSGKIEDPFGHLWMISTHKEDVTAEEIQQRFAAFFQ